MKNIIYTLSICLLLVSVESQAQFINFGLKGGLNFPSLNSTGGEPDWDGKTGWHAGIMAKVNIPIIAVQGEVLYSQTTFELPEVDDFKNTNLAIPITAQFSFLKLFSIHAGPQFNFSTSQELGDIDFSDQIDDKTINFVAGAGLNLGQLDCHFRFVFPSKSDIQIVDSVTSGYKSSNWQLSVGYWFK